MKPLIAYCWRLLVVLALAAAGAALLNGCATTVPPAGLVREMYQHRWRAHRSQYRHVRQRALPPVRREWRTRDPL